MHTHKYPRLISDIGGTNARFCIETAPYVYDNIQRLSCHDYASLTVAVKHYLSLINMLGVVESAAITMPTPIVDDVILMVNSPWQTFSMTEARAELETLNLKNVIFINDWQAMALALPHIPKEDLVQIGGTEPPNELRPKAAIGAGTGLGMATLIRHPKTGDYLSVTAEGGRSSFGAITEDESALWRYAHTLHNHVSIERFLSGPGLQLIYQGLCHIENRACNNELTPEEIVTSGINNQDYICKKTVDMFCQIFGTFAANYAVMVNSFGGVYIGGGIIPKMLDYFMQSDFRKRFEAKGRYRPFLEKMPAYIIISKYPAFFGASYALDTYLKQGYIP